MFCSHSRHQGVEGHGLIELAQLEFVLLPLSLDNWLRARSQVVRPAKLE
jgi:hypothetical protein